GQAAHPQSIQVDTERHTDRSDEHTVAETADAITRRIELELERAPEDLDGRRGVDRVEGAEPIEHGLDPARRDLLERRPRVTPGFVAEEPAHDPVRELSQA